MTRPRLLGGMAIAITVLVVSAEPATAAASAPQHTWTATSAVSKHRGLISPDGGKKSVTTDGGKKSITTDGGKKTITTDGGKKSITTDGGKTSGP